MFAIFFVFPDSNRTWPTIFLWVFSDRIFSILAISVLYVSIFSSTVLVSVRMTRRGSSQGGSNELSTNDGRWLFVDCFGVAVVVYCVWIEMPWCVVAGVSDVLAVKRIMWCSCLRCSVV